MNAKFVHNIKYCLYNNILNFSYEIKNIFKNIYKTDVSHFVYIILK